VSTAALRSILAVALAAAGCSGSGGSDVVPGAEAVTLADVQGQIFSTTCAVTDCHIGTEAPFGLDLSAGLAAGNLVGVESGQNGDFLRVEPGRPNDSYLYMKLTADERIGGDPMPAVGPPLSARQLTLIEDWIEQGAQ
jgi:hypothetical protein